MAALIPGRRLPLELVHGWIPTWTVYLCQHYAHVPVVVKTHRRAATGNTRSREVPGTASGSRSLGQRPISPAHTLAW
jgi:hypothetical protein